MTMMGCLLAASGVSAGTQPQRQLVPVCEVLYAGPEAGATTMLTPGLVLYSRDLRFRLGVYMSRQVEEYRFVGRTGDTTLEFRREVVRDGRTRGAAPADRLTLEVPDSMGILRVGAVGGRVRLRGREVAFEVVEAPRDTYECASDDLPSTAAALSFDLSQLAPRRDSLRILIQGNALGAQTSELRTENDALVFTERTTIPLMGMVQETRVVMDATTLAPRSVDQTGQVGPQPAELHIVVTDGRVWGRAQTPQPGGQPRVAEVDTVLAAGTLDVNQVQAVVPGLPLSEGASFTVNVFNASDGSTRPYSIRVEAIQSVAVPAGTFEAFRVVMSGGAFPVVLFVTRTTPRRVVKVEAIGQPIVFELVP
jgi:hypothetical protein